MYNNLGIHWASSIPAFLALACVPFLFVFYHYGPKIRMKCKYAREADEIMTRMMAAQSPAAQKEHDSAEQGVGIREGEQEVQEFKEDRTESDDTGSDRTRTGERMV